MTYTIFVILAGLMGAAGVTLTAASTHAAPGAGLDSAGSMLLFHAAAVLGAILVVRLNIVLPPVGILAAAGFVLGAALFSGDIALRAFAGHRLFPMAAPTGGTILILAWLVLSVAAIITLVRQA